MKPSIFPLTGALILACALLPAHAATRNWTGGNGSGYSWNNSANWSDNTPPSVTNDESANFQSATHVEINVASGSSASSLTLAANAHVILKLAPPTLPDTTSLTTTAYLDVSGNGASSSFRAEGIGAIWQLQRLRVSSNDGVGSSATFGNGITVTSSFLNGDSNSTIGRFGTQNYLRVEEGANVTLDNLDIGYTLGDAANRVEVRGANSTLTIGGGGSQRGLRIGTSQAGSSFANAMHNNYLHVQQGGKLVVTSNTTANSILWIGTQQRAHGNYLLVEGAGSVVELAKGASTSGTTVVIGNSAGTNFGDNYLEVRNGGALRSGTGHTNTLYIYGHDTSEPLATRSNRLTIGAGGTAELTGAIQATGGLLQLDGAGTLTASAITISQGGRFEAAGNGLTATTTIASTGTLAISDTALALSRSITLQTGSTLELELLDPHTAAGLHLATGGSLTLASDVTLRLTLADGFNLDSGGQWQLFSGETTSIIGSFNLALIDLPTLSSGLNWDLSAFHQDGSWTVAIVPEPGTYALWLLGSGALLLHRRRRHP